MIVPITTTKIDWNTLLKSAQQTLDRSLTSQVDAVNLSLELPSAYVSALGAIKNPQLTVAQIMNNPGNLMDHIFQGFLVIATKQVMYDIREATTIALTHSQTKISEVHLGIMSGTLSTWVTTIINGCSDLVSYEVRNTFNQCLQYFEKVGLGIIWKDYSKIHKNDKTLYLRRN